MYWATALANQNDDADLKDKFSKVAKDLKANETKIVAELIAAQGKKVDIGGYYVIDEEKMIAAMRPSATLNEVLASI
jgi:isocitrate dehydrogenase